MTEEIDVTQALKDAENSLRDFIATVLQSKFGDGWIDLCGVTQERIQKWQERKATEAKRQEAGAVDERLIYYADFYDLRSILNKHWTHFAPALGDKKTMDVWLDELEKLRDPDAHRRELLPHQKHLVIGVSGEIRNRLIKYRSKQETAQDCFPRIESARDSLGNIWTPQSPSAFLHCVDTKTTLRPGDVVDYVVTARDPLGAKLRYGMSVRGPIKWQDVAEFTVRIAQEHIAASLGVFLYVASPRAYHAKSGHDDEMTFLYTVLPPRQPL